jgi:hypothetical protein
MSESAPVVRLATGPHVLADLLDIDSLILGGRPFRAISGGRRQQSPIQQGSTVPQLFREKHIRLACDK